MITNIQPRGADAAIPRMSLQKIVWKPLFGCMCLFVEGEGEGHGQRDKGGGETEKCCTAKVG
jgi:hypothetical protein